MGMKPTAAEQQENLTKYGGTFIVPRRVKKITDYLTSIGGYYTARLESRESTLSRISQEALQMASHRGAPTLETVTIYVIMMEQVAELKLVDVHAFEDHGKILWAVALPDYFKGLK